MAATGFHMLSGVIGERHKLLSVGVVLPPGRRFSVSAFSSKQKQQKSFREYLEAAREFIRPEDNSPSRWFSPLLLESKARRDRAPLLLFLPG